MLHPHSKNFEWYVMADPGTSGSAFAVLFIAYDRFLPKAFFVDELYETNPIETTTPKMGARIIEKCKLYHPHLRDWNGYFDSAAAWFGVHFQEKFQKDGLIFSPVEKSPGEKEDGLDTLISMLDNNELEISTNCPATIWEFDNYKRKDGKLTKKNDHQLDNSRYFVKKSGIMSGNPLDREDASKYRTLHKRKRMFSIEDDLNKTSKSDVFGKILKHYGE